MVAPTVAPTAAPTAAPKYNRYTEQLAEMQRNSAFGVFIPDLLKAKSGGKEDIARNIKLLIRKQYYNNEQVVRLVVTFLVLGMMIAAALYSSLWSPLDTKEYYQSFAFGIFAGAFAGMFYWYMFGANWESVCNGHHPEVDADKHGIDCVDPWDCTVGSIREPKGMCTYRRPSSYARFLRNSLMFFMLVGAGVFAGMASTANNWNGKHVFAGFVFGAACGMFIWQLFPLESRRG